MGRVAYTVKDAAEACAVAEAIITEAIRDESLIARAVGSMPIVAATDLKAWVSSLPRYQI